jgi:molybdenum cofactor synthesis domain-containing protein
LPGRPPSAAAPAAPAAPAARHDDTYSGAVISLAAAQQLVLEAVGPLPARDVALTEALGLVLAAPVVAAEDVPPFANSAVDGYAVRAADTAPGSVELIVAGELAAGQAPPSRPLQSGEAMRIMTGAAVPPGADAIVMVEDSERIGDDRVRLTTRVSPGVAVREPGSDVVAGTPLFGAGTFVTPAVLGVLSSVNARTVAAHPSPRVAVLSTGDELVTDGSPLAPGQIRESNLTMLAPMLERSGCVVHSFGVVPDDEARLEAVLHEAARESDAIVTSGGVSMGDYDVVKAVLGRIAEMQWMQVAIKPAKPFAFGLLRDEAGDGDLARSVPVFGLPGNPVSSLVSFEMFARPALRRMAGHRRLARPSVVAVADADLTRRSDGKTHLVRVVAAFADDGRVHVTPVTAQGSHQLAATASANAIAVLDDGDGVSAGDEVAVLLLDLG